jgi:undecaprenyl-phosphate galactose phosphotransferase
LLGELTRSIILAAYKKSESGWSLMGRDMQIHQQATIEKFAKSTVPAVAVQSGFVGGDYRSPLVVLHSEKIEVTQLQAASKRILDLFAVMLLVLLFLPIILFIAVSIFFASGRQVFYGQTRVGRGGREFTIYKFRSMVLNSDEVLQQLLDSDPEANEQWQREFKLKDDPRITRIGRFIRRTSLDELPQFWNVLRGDMSLVGPRPVLREELDLHYQSAMAHYLSVSPGLTGLWQVSGRNDLTYEQRVALDKHYVESLNLTTDILIMLRTAGVMFGRSGAY